MKRRVSWAVLVVIAWLAMVGTGLATDWAAAQGAVNVIVNNVQAVPIEGQSAYTVTTLVSVLDAEGQPIAGLSADDFSLSQDGEPVTLESAKITEQPATIVLVIDTSGSMAAEGKMQAVIAAADTFLDNLGEDDQVGLISFNEQVTVEQSPSTALDAAGNIIRRLEAISGTGTCLYDAAHTGVGVASTAPVGRRAVLLLTDGIDEKPDGGQCSVHSVDDVIASAVGGKEGVNRIPIYTIGVGITAINPIELRRIADETGGVALQAPHPADVATLFETLAAQLKNQYALVYRSAMTSGQHNLTVSVSAEGMSGVGRRDFIAPELPAVLSLSGLDDGAILEGSREVRATVSGAVDIAQVRFTLDGTVLDEIATPPFAVRLDGAALEPGAHRLKAAATLEDGTELSAELTFAVQAAPPPDEQQSQEAAQQTGAAHLPTWPIVAAIGGAALLALIGLAVILSHRKPQGVVIGDTATGADLKSIPPAEVVAILVVKESQSLTPAQRFDLSDNEVKLGRGVDNTLIVPDAPVSRNHARLACEGDSYRVFDLGSTYGTFVNGLRVGPEGLLLCDGDELQLGTRTRLTYMLARRRETSPTDVTLDFDAETPSTIRGARIVEIAEDEGRTMPIDEGDQDELTLPLDDDEKDDKTLPVGDDDERERADEA